jgi:O-methyltransferase
VSRIPSDDAPGATVGERVRVRAHAARRAARFFRDVPPRDVLRPHKVLTLARVRQFTMVSYPRLSALYDLASSLTRAGVAGAVAECGVWNGGSAAAIAEGFRRGGQPREVWLFDSWEGLPEPDEIDVSTAGTRREIGWNLGSERAVEEIFFARLGFNRDQVHLVKGWFEDTLPAFRATSPSIALLHLDGDWYRSVRLSLDQLYDLVAPGGVVVVDDYGYWEGSRKAVDEFLIERRLPRPFGSVGSAVYLRKPNALS